MTNRNDPEAAAGRQARLVSVVIVATALIWVAAQILGGLAGVGQRYMLLIDLFALAAFLWSLIVLWKLRRSRRGQ